MQKTVENHYKYEIPAERLPLASSTRTYPDHLDPKMRTRTYWFPKEKVFEKASVIATELSGWKVTESDGERGVIKAHVPALLTTDTITIQIREKEEGITTVDALLKYGKRKLDLFGRNGNIKKFLKELDVDLSHIKPKKEEEKAEGEEGEAEAKEVDEPKEA